MRAILLGCFLWAAVFQAGAQNPPAGAQSPPAGAQNPPVGAQNPPVGAQNPPVGAQNPPAGAAPAPVSSPALAQAVTKRIVYESVVALEGKTIGTNILIEVGENDNVTGWIQRNDFFPIDSGHADADKIAFTSGGNQYTINLRTSRINYSGPDGSGNQRVEKMTRVEGRVYKLTEEAEDEERKVTLQIDGGEKDYLIGHPAVWKRAGPPIDRFGRMEEVLGKTVSAWLARIGGTRYLAVLEEPEGTDLQKKAPKPPKAPKKDKKKK